MPVRQTTINKFGEKYYFSLTNNATLFDFLVKIELKSYPKNNTYVLIELDHFQFKVYESTGIYKFISLAGSDCLSLYIRDLPAILTSRVVSVDIEGSGLRIVESVAANPRSCVIVIDKDSVIGLFVNKDLDADLSFFSSLSLSVLHGELKDLSDDIRAKINNSSSKPVCPKCGYIDYYKFYPEGQVFRCRKCFKIIEVL